MSPDVEERYTLKLLDHPFDLIELIARILGLIAAAFLSFTYFFSNVTPTQTKILILTAAAIMFLLHLIIQKCRPHLFHPPRTPSIKPPLSESIRASNIYLLASVIYIAIVLFSILKLVYPIEKLIPPNNILSQITVVLSYLASILFFLSVTLYVPVLNKISKKDKQFVIGDMFVIVPLVTTYVYILVNSSFYVSFYLFGKILLGSISLMMLKDLLFGKWTHQLPTQ